MEMGELARDGGRGDTTCGEGKVDRREEGDGLGMGVDKGGSSPSEESERCMTEWIPGSV